MDHLSAYSSLLIPGVVALVLLVVLMKVVGTIIKLVSLIVFAAILIGGFVMYGRISAIQSAADAVTRQSSGVNSAAALIWTANHSARRVAADLGLDPAYLRVSVHCVAAQPQVSLRYVDDKFMFGLLSHQDFPVPLSTTVRC